MRGACGAVVSTVPLPLGHGRAWPGHPRLCPLQHRQSQMAGTSMPLGGPQARPEGPAMTQWGHQPVILTHMGDYPWIVLSGGVFLAVADAHIGQLGVLVAVRLTGQREVIAEPE